MILESVQILCTVLNKKGCQTPYKSTHINHPCVIWAGNSFDNFKWLNDLTIALNNEYLYRYNKSKNHKSIEVLNAIEGYEFASYGLEEFPQAMPETFKVSGNAVLAYRQFYVGEKLKFARWTNRSVPFWIKDLVAND
jgi:hypothetical protein